MSVAQPRRISTLVMSRAVRSMTARVSRGAVALSRLWPGRADRLIIAPHDLRTADVHSRGGGREVERAQVQSAQTGAPPTLGALIGHWQALESLERAQP